MTSLQCPGSYAQANREFDNVVSNAGSGAWATGTCPVCGLRAPVMRPLKRRPILEFGRHNLSAKRRGQLEIDELVRENTAFTSLAALVAAPYTPTLRNERLADAYDAAARAAGTGRKAGR